MTILINTFTKGWQNAARHELMANEAMYLCRDMSLDITGSLRCRNLSSENAYFATQTCTSNIEDVYQINVEGADKQLMFYRIGGSLYCWNSITNATRTISTAMSGEHISYAPALPLLSDTTFVYITDGTTMLADNGTTTITWGIDPPEAAPSISILAALGRLSAGTYRYIYTFYDNDTGSESDPSPACAALTAVANDGMTVSNIRTSDNSRVTTRRLYRTLAGGGSYYLVVIISDNTTTTFIDTFADADLSTEAILDQGIPPTVRIAYPYKKMLLLTGDDDYPNRVYITLVSGPDNVPEESYIETGKSGDKVMNICELEGRIHLITKAGIGVLYGETPDTLLPQETLAHVGTYARWTAKTGPDGIYYLANNGVYRFNGKTSSNVSEPIGRCFGNTPGRWFDIVDKSTAAESASACFLNGVYYLLVPMKDINGSVSNRLLAYDTQKSSGAQTWLLYNVVLKHITSDTTRDKLFGSMEKPDSAGSYSVYELFSTASSSIDTATPEVVSKSFKTMEGQKYSLGGAGGITQSEELVIAWLRKFRVDADGDWDFDFYLDDRLVYSLSLSNLSIDDNSTWHDFPPNLKGRYVYVNITGTGTPQPDSHIIREIEIK